MNTRKLELTEEQLNVVERALEFYYRIGIGQFDRIKDHPTFEKFVYKFCTPDKEPEVGDRTPQGEILEIKDGKALIAGSVKDGIWDKEHEWKKIEDVVLSTDYSRFHAVRDAVDNALAHPRNMLINNFSLPIHGSWGIHNENVDDSCRIAFDIQQVIRHELWKERCDKTFYTVDASVSFTHNKDSNKIKLR